MNDHSTAVVAERAGIHRDTLLRWLREGVVPEPNRDHRGWRTFSEPEAVHIEAVAKGVGASFKPPEVTRLEGMDWDFADAKTTYLTHGIHPYPAKFIPQIPNALIQELSGVGDTVADIFCGSGTTLVESMTLKRNAVGIDANPLACLISRAKVAQLDEAKLTQLGEIAEKALSTSQEISEQRPLFPDQQFISRAPRPSADAMAFWFEPFVIEELAEILSWCRRLPAEAKDVALAAFSSIVVTVSKQDSDTRYVRRTKQLVPGDAFKRFARSLLEAIHFVREFTELVEPRFHTRVVCENILSRPSIGSVDLVVCSPPYPNAYSYHLYHMTRMIWLEMDQPTFKRVEIGSHRKYSAKGASMDVFRQEMETVFSWLATTLRPKGYACFVVGDSIIRGETHSNAEIIAHASKKNGFVEMARIPRRLKDTKKAFNPVIGKIKSEHIVILRH